MARPCPDAAAGILPLYRRTRAGLPAPYLFIIEKDGGKVKTKTARPRTIGFFRWYGALLPGGESAPPYPMRGGSRGAAMVLRAISMNCRAGAFSPMPLG